MKMTNDETIMPNVDAMRNAGARPVGRPGGSPSSALVRAGLAIIASGVWAGEGGNWLSANIRRNPPISDHRTLVRCRTGHEHKGNDI